MFRLQLKTFFHFTFCLFGTFDGAKGFSQTMVKPLNKEPFKIPDEIQTSVPFALSSSTRTEAREENLITTARTVVTQGKSSILLHFGQKISPDEIEVF